MMNPHPRQTLPALRLERSRFARRGSVLVLVMTLLSILFVTGVAFLATMNFEADLVDAELRGRSGESGVAAVEDVAGDLLKEGFLAAGAKPFAATGSVTSRSAFAAQPGWDGATSPLEPARFERPNGAHVYQIAFADPSLAGGSSKKESPLIGLRLDVNWAPGSVQSTRNCVGGAYDGDPCATNSQCQGGTCEPLKTCQGGLNDGRRCLNDAFCPPGPGVPTPACMPLKVCVGGARDGGQCNLPSDCGGSPCLEKSIVVTDADGDGVVDSVQFDLSELGLPSQQAAALSSLVNPSSGTTGKTFVGLRVVPHGGMVNLNDSHMRLIETALKVPSLIGTPNFRFGPLQTDPAFYSPLQEESVLRRRGFLPPRRVPASRLHGDAAADVRIAVDPPGGGDMAYQLFPARSRGRESVLDDDHRYWPLSMGDLVNPGDKSSPSLWAARMEPLTALSIDPDASNYSRRHLVTTVSHDDLLSRGGMVMTDAGPLDVFEAMLRLNRSRNVENECNYDDVLDTARLWRPLPFEYAEYPGTLADDTIPNDVAECDCPTREVCRRDPRKGRLQLSLAWMDDYFESLLADASTAVNAFDARLRVLAQRNHLLHDAFFLLLNNARGPYWDGDRECRLDSECPSGFTCVAGDCRAICQVNNQCAGGEQCVGGACLTPCTGTATCASARQSCVATKDGTNVCLGECAFDTDCGSGLACRDGECVDRVLGQSRRDALISRTAASLTANMLDYMDRGECLSGAKLGQPCDTDGECGGGVCRDIPTRIALRSFDFAGTSAPGIVAPRRECSSGPVGGQTCTADSQCGGTGSSATCQYVNGAAGLEFGAQGGLARLPQYVYGLEAQPFIMQVASKYVNINPPPNAANISNRYIELFNPYPFDIQGRAGDELWIYEVDPGASDPIATANRVQITAAIPGGNSASDPFLVVYSGGGDVPVPVGGMAPIAFDLMNSAGGQSLQFLDGWVIYLVRRVTFPGDGAPTEVVLDQFELPLGGTLGNPNPEPMPAPNSEYLYSRERIAQNNQKQWASSLPFAIDAAPLLLVPPPTVSPGLGTWTVTPFTQPLHPVELSFPNTGSFTKRHQVAGQTSLDFSVAFPTTGSMLLTLRHANRAFGDIARQPVVGSLAPYFDFNLAFNTWLDDEMLVYQPNGALAATIRELDQIDNGRMPVFDRGTTDPNTGLTYSAHHVDPWKGDAASLFKAGDTKNLPWGQFVFDYFTALPLSGPGPYRSYDPNLVGLADAQPRVDLNGLRVHGRLDINAAPWTVLAGLPHVPMQKIPTVFRDRIRNMLGPFTPGGQVATDSEAAVLGSRLAQALVSYREQRMVLADDGQGGSSGDYSADGFGRGWAIGTPAFRRGTGFLSVGEIANVRHGQLVPSPSGLNDYRSDYGRVDVNGPDGADYVEAVALLAALGDWTTVRSQVFTVYGVVRGDADANFVPSTVSGWDEGIRHDINARALRFQETVDRLPTFLGEPLPVEVGEGTVAPYADVQND